jgi:hypothetical protein
MKTKVPGRLPTARLKSKSDVVADPTPVTTSEQQVVARFVQDVRQLPALSGLTPGARATLLNACKTVEKLAERYWPEARELLKEDGSAIPGWRVEIQIRRRLKSQDALDFFDKLAFASTPLDLSERQVLEACSNPSITELEKLHGALPDELIVYDGIERLVQDKESERS